MRKDSLFPLLAVIVAMHALALSVVLGILHPGYLLTATLSGTLIWTGVLCRHWRKRRMSIMIGFIVGLAVQQTAYLILRTELGGLWWPLAQFAALHYLIAYGLSRLTP